MRYVEIGHNDGEYYVFEIKWSDEEEWGLEMCVPVDHDMIHYTALTCVREWIKNGVEIHFA